MFVTTAAAAPTTPQDPHEQPRRRKRSGLGVSPAYLYLLPALTLLALWTYRPLAQTFQLSFYDWNMLPTADKVFVGAEKYTEVVALPEMQGAIINTVVYILAFLVFSIVLPIFIALMARQVRGKAKTVYQALIFVPFLITPVATSAVWRWLFAERGAIPTIASGLFGVDLDYAFRDPDRAIWAVIVVVGWQMIGFGVLVISAGFAGIGKEYAHAASLDGAGAARITRKITLPLLSPTIVFLTLMTVLLAAQWTYPIIDILTQGGPRNSTTNIYYLLYEFGFRNFDAGLSAAAGVLFFIAFSVIAVLFLELQERLSFYDN